MVYMSAYTGARFSQGSCGSSEINLTQVPIPFPGTPATTFTFVLAFANDDGEGNFEPQWDTDHFSAQNLAGVRKAMPWVNFTMSLGGGNASWPSPGNSKSWIRNAVRSITDIMQTYGISGVDVDYENGLDDTFVPVMSSLMRQVSIWSLAPDNQNLDMYLDLCNTVGFGRSFNFQAYSMETEDSQKYIDRYTYIRDNLTSVTSVGLGIDTNTAQPRGMQYPGITDLCFSQFEEGSTVPQNLWSEAMIWSIEDSCLNNYPVERALSTFPGQPGRTAPA